MDDLDVLDWRERTAALYLSDVDLVGFRAGRDELFADPSAVRIPAAERAAFTGLRCFPPNPAAMVEVPLRAGPGDRDIDTGGPDGVVHYRRVGGRSRRRWGR